MSYLELSDLHKHFAGKLALRGLTLNVAHAEFVSLLGPSGCGKTTTLRIVAGFESADSGIVRLEGQNLLALPANRRGVGVVFQNYALFPHLTAFKNIAFGLAIAGVSSAAIRTRVVELLDMVGLSDAGEKFPQQMSGGQQQRIALARALATRPRLLLLDEPLSALDAVIRVALREEIKRIQTALGMTTIYITHDQEEALAVSDRIVVMRNGSIEQIGTAEQIYSQPCSRFVASFIGKMNQIDAKLVDPTRGTVACGFDFRVPAALTRARLAGSRLTILIRPEGITISRASPQQKRDGHSDAVNKIVAQVTGTTFLGSIRRLVLQAGPQRLIADVPSAVAGEGLGIGETASLSIPVESCGVLPDDETSCHSSGAERCN